MKLTATTVTLFGLAFTTLQCRIPKITNDPHYAIKSYSFDKSKYQVKDLLDSLVLKSSIIFWQEGRSYGEMLLNIKDNADTITFYLLFDESDLQWVSKPDSVKLLLADIGRYKDWKAEEQPFFPKIDSVKELEYQKIFDSLIIKPLKARIASSDSYVFHKLSVGENLPAKWVICKNRLNAICDTVFIDSYIKGRFLGGYRIIPKDSL